MPRLLARIPRALSFTLLSGVFLAATVALPHGQAPGPAQGAGRGGQGGQVATPRGGRGQQPVRDNNTSTSTVGTGSISGSVILDGSGTPVRRARVSLTGTELRGGRSTVTDDQGRFIFQALPAGRFSMTASKAGYVDMAYGAKRPGRPGTPIQLADGQKLDKTVIAIPRGSVLTGIVVDENGEPSPGTQVRAMRYVIRTGERTLQQAGTDQTDDRGLYRIYQLQPGDYVVSAVPRNMNIGDLRTSIAAEVSSLVEQAQALGVAQPGARGAGGFAFGGGALEGRGGPGQQLFARAAELQQQLASAEQEQATAYAPVYYPGTTSLSSAATVTLGPGEERNGIDFRLELLGTASLDGVVTGPDGTLPPNVQVALVPSDRGGMPSIPGFGTNMTRVNASGQFSFRNVTPGQYSLQARANIFRPQDPSRAQGPGPGGREGGGPRAGGPQPIAQVLWAAVDVTVSGQNLSNVGLMLQPGMTVSGRVDFDGTAAAADVSRARVSLVARGQQALEIGAVPPGEVDASGRFTINGVAPGRYSFSAMASAQPTGRGAAAGRGAGTNPTGQTTAPWILKSAMVNGRDALDFPVEIGPGGEISTASLTFTDRTQELSGTIQDASGRPISEYTIIVFPSDRQYWTPQSRRIASTRPATDGKFSVRSLPAGDYRLTAVTDVEPGEWYDPAFLSQLLSASISVSLAEGEKKVQDIRLAGGGR